MRSKVQVAVRGKEVACKDSNVPVFSFCLTPDLESITGEALVLEDKPMCWLAGRTAAAMTERGK